MRNPTYSSNPRKRNPLKAIFYHGAPEEVCGRAFALPIDISLSGDYLDWGPEFTAKVQLPEPPPTLSVALRGALSGGAL
jgi:hypothetical protein